MLQKLRSFDIITLLFSIFILAIPIVIFTFNTINNNIYLFSQQSDTITKLKLLDKDFDTFTSQKGLFSNYDIINAKTEAFQNELLHLKRLMHTSKKQHHYLTQIDAIMKDFEQKKEFLERTKSYNSIIINSINYLHDLEKNIKKYSPLTQEEINLLNDTLFLSIQFYTNNSDGKQQIKENLAKIKSIMQSNNDRYLDYFYQHENSLVQKITQLKEEKKKVSALHLYQRLDKLYKNFQQDFHNYLTMGKTIVTMMMFALGTLLIVILYLYRKSLEQKKELGAYKYAIENSDNSIVITNLNKNITFVNEAFERETGYTKEEALGQNPRILKSDLLDKSHYDALNEALKKNEKWEGEFINKRKDGTIYYEKASISPMIVDHKVIGYIAIKLNITKYIEQEKKVKFLAYHDTLTSLPNRHNFEQYFQNHIQKEKKEVALLFIDLDHFKNINDTLGHHAGDALLKVFAKRLKSEISQSDFIARIGGDEFVAIIELSDRDKIRHIASRILYSLQEPITIHEHKLNITTSIGIALYPKDGESLDTLLKHADTAMYKAKNNGRNNFHFFTEALSKEAYQRLTIEQELRTALEKEELYLMYQPKYKLATKEIIGFEALIRWENEKLGFVPPDKFISIAEEVGLISQIGYFVFQKACEDFYRLRQHYPALKHIAINVSTMQMKDKTFIEHINQLCQKAGLCPEDIEIELTESYIMEDIQKNIEKLHTLREYGYRIAIDDFGTGYSSFSYLKQLPVTTLKIDKSFVDDICIDRRDKNIVDTIITLAKNLSFTTVAEGIEHKEQEKMLQKMQCEIAQGYLFSKPLKYDDALKFITTKRKEKAFG